jgi:hypothetical protein
VRRREFLLGLAAIPTASLLPKVAGEGAPTPLAQPLPGGATITKFGICDDLSVKLWSKAIAKECLKQTQLMQMIAVMNS